ncbi:MAG: hypothetical protein FJ135_00975 [Deltaproteobacteria bacterium]|nr:hypothetical protein [Deltaproteobacteria bacterium]
MSRFFSLHGPGEKKYIFNSFLVFVLVVEIIILGVTIIWQMDEGWFGGEVKVIPFPWQEYLLVAFIAPVVMMLVFGIIVRGFDLLQVPGTDHDRPGKRIWQRFCHKCSLISYIMGLMALFAFVFGLLYPETVLVYLQGLFSTLGLWGTYVVIGIMALSMLYFPISLLLRYRLAKKAMECEYLLTLSERYGVIIDKASGRVIPPGERPEAGHSLPQHPDTPAKPQLLS